MRKKTVALLLCLLLVVSMSSFMLAGCGSQKTKIVYLGDSIAEAVLGPSPLSERENYGYYALLGRRNDFEFYNRSVSGHKSAQLLSLIKEEDKSAKITQSLIKEADIIHISILGNDILQADMSGIIYSAAHDDFTEIDKILASSYNNISKIVAELKTLNSDAVVIFQNVYNPFSPESTLINATIRADLEAEGFTANELRAIGRLLLDKFNGVLSEYLTANPNAFYIADACKAFDDIYIEDAERGKALIYTDFVHPSNEGHAVLADINQKLLEELGFAKKSSAIRKYKAIKIEQIERMYGSTVDVDKVKTDIRRADSCEEITKIFFAATSGITPVYC